MHMATNHPSPTKTEKITSSNLRSSFLNTHFFNPNKITKGERFRLKLECVHTFFFFGNNVHICAQLIFPVLNEQMSVYSHMDRGIFFPSEC